MAQGLKILATLFGGKDGAKTVNAPVVFGDIVTYDLSTTFVASDDQLYKGVFFKADADGVFTCITVAQYLANGGDIASSSAEMAAAIALAISSGNEVDLILASNQWSDTPVVRISSVGAPTTSLNLGLY